MLNITLRKKKNLWNSVSLLFITTLFLIQGRSANAEQVQMDYDVTLTAYSVDDKHLIIETSAKCKKFQACWVTLEKVYALKNGDFSNAQISMVWKPVPFSNGVEVLDIQSRISKTLVKGANNYIIDEEKATEIFLRDDYGVDRVRVFIEIDKHKKSFFDKIFLKIRSYI